MIRMKGKMLVLSAVFLLFSLTVSITALPSLLYHYEKYDVLLRWFPYSKQAPDALYWSAYKALNQADKQQDRVYLFPSNSSYSESVDPSAALNAISQLERLLDSYPNYRFHDQVQWKLLELYIPLKNWKRANELINEIQDSRGSGNYFSDKELDYYERMLSSKTQVEDSEPAVMGKVTIGGQNVEDALVILKEYQGSGGTSYSNPLGRYPIAITDENGAYRFYDVDQGEYEVGVGIDTASVDGYYLTEESENTVQVGAAAEHDAPLVYNREFVPIVKVEGPVDNERIKDHLRFEWQPYPEAAYYQLGIESLEKDAQGRVFGSSSQLLNEQFKEPYAEFDLDTLRTYPRGFGWSYREDRVYLTPNGILGLVYPGGQFLWYVDAFDAGGRKISSSRGYYPVSSMAPLFRTDDEGMLEGDRQVLAGDYGKAVEAYEQEGDHPYALRALAVLWLQGWQGEETGADHEKAIGYLQRLKQPTDFDYNLLLSSYEEVGRKEEADRLRERLKLD